MTRVLFIHRSVGRNLLADGHIRELLAAGGSGVELFDYDQNVDSLTDAAGVGQKMGFVFPGGDTRPIDYAAIFSDTADRSSVAIRDFALSFDCIIIKSCYPNSNLRSDAELEAARASYRTIAAYFQAHSRQLIVVTSPPMSLIMARSAAARRGRKLANWLVATGLGSHVSVFDLFDLLAAPDASLGANRLKWGWQRPLLVDSHPNRAASRFVASKLVDFIITSNPGRAKVNP